MLIKIAFDDKNSSTFLILYVIMGIALGNKYKLYGQTS